MLQCLLSKIRRRCGKEVFYEARPEQTDGGRGRRRYGGYGLI